MNENKFKEWLINDMGKDLRQAGDILSRCRRVERVLDISLDGATASEDKFSAMMERLAAEANNYLKPGSNRITALGQLRSAARLHATQASLTINMVIITHLSRFNMYYRDLKS